MIKVNNIKKHFGELCVLDDVSFSVKDGTIYGLIGHNGAGKTTLMTIMAGICLADSGSCELQGKRISYLPDIPGFFEYLTCREYIDFLNCKTTGICYKSSKELLGMVGLSEKKRINELSRGMRQRLGISAALVSNPDVLLLDEPTSALDPSGRMEVLEILKCLKNEGKSIVLSTHVLADMEKICDEVGFLHKGKIQKQIKIGQLKDNKSWIISFKERPNMQSKNELYKIENIGENDCRISMIGSNTIYCQQEILQILSVLPVQIETIRNDSQNLDEIFQEVCRP